VARVIQNRKVIRVAFTAILLCIVPAHAGLMEPPAVEVIFHAPGQDEAGVSLRTPVRLQFSADLEASTLEHHVLLEYSIEDSRERGEPQPPAIRFWVTYDGKDRSVTIQPSAPWERFRQVRLRLLEGIRGTSGAPLAPFALSFTTGGS